MTARAFLSQAAAEDGLRLTVLEAGTGAAALATSRSETPGCILLKQYLPDIDGPGLLACLKQGSDDLPVAVVMLTDSADKALTKSALQAGAHEYLPKRFMDPDLLLRAVRSARDRFDLIADRRRVETALQAEQAARAAEIRLTALADSAPGVLYQSERTAAGLLKVHYVSANVERILGYTVEQVLAGRAWPAMLDQEASDLNTAAMANARRTGRGEYECWITHVRGHRMRINVTTRAVPTTNGGWLFTGTLLDVTALYEANAVRAAGAARLAEQVNAAPAVLFQTQRMADGRQTLLYVSANVERVCGYTAEHFLVEGAWDALLSRQTREQHSDAVAEAKRTGHSEYECWLTHGRGHQIRVNLSTRAVQIADGAWLFTGTMLDVTAQYEANAARADADARLTAMLNDARSVIVQKEQMPDGPVRLTYVSDNAVRMTGYTARYLMANGWASLLDTDGQAARAACISEAIRAERGEAEAWMRHADGHRIRIRSTMRAVIDADGTRRFTSNISDVTALYEANAARADANARLAAMLNDAPSLVSQTEQSADGQVRMIYVSDNAFRITGYSPEYLMANGWDALLEDDGLAARATNFSNAIRTGHSEAEAWMRHADGHRIRIRVTVRAVVDADGTRHFTSNISDVTALHEANAARAASDMRLLSLLNDSPSILTQAEQAPNGQRRLTYVSDNALRITGYTAESLMANDWAALIEADGEAARAACYSDAIRTGNGEIEMWIRHADGHRIRIRSTLRAIADANGGLQFISNTADVTAAYEASAARAALETRLSALLNDGPSVLTQSEQTPDGEWRVTYVSENVIRLNGYSPAYIMAHGWASLCDPEGRATRVANLSDSTRTGFAEGEAWMRHADGHRIRIRATTRAVAGVDGTWQSITSMSDITALHEANAARLASEARLFALVNDAPTVLTQSEYAADGQLRQTYVSENAIRIVGYAAEHIMARGWRSLFDAESAAARDACLREAVRSGYSEFEASIRHGDGHAMRIRVVMRAVAGADGTWQITSNTFDVTAMYEADAARSLAEAKVATVLKDSPTVVSAAELTPDGRYLPIYVSDNITQMLGYPAEYFMTEGAWAALLDDEGRAARREVIQAAIATGSSEAESWVRHAGGHRVRIRRVVRAVRLGENHWYIIGNYLDVTAVFEANAARTAADAKLELLVQDGPGVLFQEQKINGAWFRTYVSPNVSQLTGYKASHYIGPVAAQRLASDASGAAAWKVALDHALTNGSGAFEFTMQHADGRTFWARANLAMRRDGDGDPLLTAYLVDISAERQLAEALESSRHDLEQMMAMSPGYLFRLTLRPDGSWTKDYVSESAERIYGYSIAEIRDPAWFASILDPAQVPLLAERNKRVLRRERTVNEFRVRTKSGAWIWVADTLSPSAQHEPDGSLRVVGFATDITMLKEQTAQLQHTGRLAVLGEMATGVAHELRQPLGGISFAAQNAEFALDAGDTDSVRKRLTRILEQVERANGIIEHLRMFGRGGDAAAPRVPVSLEAVLHGTLGLIGETLRLDNIDLACAIGKPALSVMGDQVGLEQVLVNLLLNARDALTSTRTEGAARRVRIAAELVDGIVMVSVADNGGGIPADLLPQVFQPFVTTKLADKGTGLGLSICHGIISKMGGKISVCNANEGAVFTVALPVAA